MILKRKLHPFSAMRIRHIYLVFCLSMLGHSIQSQWVQPGVMDSSFVEDLRYATPFNFTGKQLYPCARCFLRPEAAAALVKVQENLRDKGFGLRLYDCFRPASVQKALWEEFPNPSYVTPPWKGSNHNRGLAVDVGLTDSCGIEYFMGSPFDHLGRKSHHDYTDLPREVLYRRTLLKEAMEKEGFSSIRTEWWHYNFYQVKYPVDDFKWKCE